MNTLITIDDVKRRSKALSELREWQYGDSGIFNFKCLNAIKSKNINQLIECIEYINNNNFSVNSLLECFDTLSEVAKPYQITRAANIIKEAEVKVRDAAALNNLLKQRLGRATHKNATKIGNKFDNVFDAVGNSMAELKQKLQVSPPSIPGTGGGSSPAAEATIEGYINLIDESNKLICCDRILENYGSISKRFNIDKLLIENSEINDIKDSINELCRLIETYDMSDKIKLNTVIESAWYGFHSNHIDFDIEDILEVATDYFLLKDNGRYICKSIIEDNVVINQNDKKHKVIYITKEDPVEEEEIKESVEDALYSYVLNNESEYPSIKEINKPIQESQDFQEIFNNFRKNSEGKDVISRLNSLVKTLYSNGVDNIIEGTPGLLSYIRRIAILGTAAIHPIVMIVTLIADCFISIHMERQETEQMIQAFKQEKKIATTKMESSEVPEEKERLKEYIKALNKAIGDIETCQYTLLTDKEIDDKYSNYDDEENDYSNEDLSDEDIEKIINSFSDDDFDFDMDFNENARLLSVLANLCEEFDNTKKYMNNIDIDNRKMMSIMSDEDMKNMATFSTMYPGCIDSDTLYTSISQYYDDIQRDGIKFESLVKKFHAINGCKDSIKIMNENMGYNIIHLLPIKENCYNLYCEIQGLKSIIEFNECIDNKNYLLEVSFTNKLKLAQEKLRKSIVNLSDKEKEASKAIDLSMRDLTRGIEKSLTNTNREAVINGSIIPSASKIIKLAIVSGGLALINPALSVISVLGYFACSKFLQNRERQRIIDEIEVELKVCEKYIEVAEQSNQLSKLKELYSIKRQLERQKQRIKYHMHVKGVVLVDPKDSEPV